MSQLTDQHVPRIRRGAVVLPRCGELMMQYGRVVRRIDDHHVLVVDTGRYARVFRDVDLEVTAYRGYTDHRGRFIRMPGIRKLRQAISGRYASCFAMAAEAMANSEASTDISEWSDEQRLDHYRAISRARLLGIADQAKANPESCVNVTGWSRARLRAYLEAAPRV